MRNFLFGKDVDRLFDALRGYPVDYVWGAIGFSIFGAGILVGYVMALLMLSLSATSYLHNDLHGARAALFTGVGVMGLIIGFQWFIRYGVKRILRKAGYDPN